MRSLKHPLWTDERTEDSPWKKWKLEVLFWKKKKKKKKKPGQVGQESSRREDIEKSFSFPNETAAA